MELTLPMNQMGFLQTHRNKIIAAVVVLMATIVWMTLTNAGAAATGVGAAFATWATTIEGWLKGSYGKLAMLVALAIASGAFAYTRDLKVLVIPCVGAIAIGIIISLVTGSFTAII